MKILLIEDNRAISKGLVYTLEQNGFEVELCENAESTLNSLGGLGVFAIFSAFSIGSAPMSFVFPWKAILISIAVVFVAVWLIMKYSISKVNKQNIIETIRNDNI